VAVGFGDLGFRFLYVGASDVQWDNSFGLGLLYMHARHYSPTIGRFLQPDPIGAEANLYGYASNSPITRSDPAGTYDDFGEGAGGYFGGLRFRINFDIGGAFKTGLGWILTAASAAQTIGNFPRVSRTARNIGPNRARGLAGEAAVAILLYQFVRSHLRFHVYFSTPIGKRFLDICGYRSPADKSQDALFCVEVKVGTSRYTRTQRAKDAWISEQYGFPIILARI
jgi:RHS repeat-associated protein